MNGSGKRGVAPKPKISTSGTTVRAGLTKPNHRGAPPGGKK